MPHNAQTKVSDSPLTRNIHGVWGSRWTFILAATGSAVGLGNIWKFPYITGENGGGAFVLVYLFCIALIGIPVMVAEVLLGRRGRQSPVNAMRYVTQEAGLSRFWVGIGSMGVLSGLCILAFYSVVAGWILDYVFALGRGEFQGADSATVGKYFSDLRANTSLVIMWHSAFILLTAAVVAAGVTKGLGMVAKVLMPLLFLMLLMMLVYGAIHGDFMRALKFMFEPDFSKVFFESMQLQGDGKWLECPAQASNCELRFTTGPTVVALGHAFFTLSLGMGSIMAYGAYMPADAKIGSTVITVGILDTLVALIAGLAIFSIVFASNIEPGSGPGLLFVSLPVAFGSMSGGLVFGAIFFTLVAIAAWSSAVSLIEPGVAWLVETGRFNRVTANMLLGLLAWCGGVASIYSSEVFNFFDFITSQVMLPLGGLLIALFVGWKMRPSIIEQEMDAEGHLLLDIWLFVLRYVSPVLVAVVFITALWKTLSA
ncbi:MAG: sodium-dependent transporter [Alteromonadaceae bacterium]|nr:MAG: sodium-dependent transporter [Alteromonadaceae bacterium]